MARKYPNIEDIAKEAGVLLQDFDRECRDCDLNDFAELCDPWELIGRHLGLTQSQLNAIKEDYSHTDMRRIKVLQKWRESSLRPRYRDLIEAFLKCGMTEQALTVSQKVKINKNTSGRPAIHSAENQNRSSKPNLSPHGTINKAIPETLASEYQMRRYVRESLRTLDRQFSGVQRQLIKAAGVTLEELKSCIATLPCFNSGSPAAPLLHSSSVDEFFHELKNYCNAQCPDILEDLVQELGDDETKRKWRDFNQEYRAFQRRTKLKDLIGNYERPETIPSDYKELKMKLGDNWREKTLEDLEQLRCQMSLRAWLLKLIEDGSVIVVYFVPSSVNHHQLNNFKEYLHSQNVLQITVESDVVSVDLDMFIGELFNHLGHSWKFFARELDFSEMDIAVLEHDYPFDMKEQIHQMFQQWRRRKGDEATPDTLLSAMKAAGFDEQVKVLTQKGIIKTQRKSDVISVDLDMFIGELFNHLGHSWKFLARELDFSEMDIAVLEHDYPFDMKEQIHQMFQQWRRRKGDEATPDRLLSAMKAAGFDEQVKALTQKGIIITQRSSADIAGSLAVGVGIPIQSTCSDDAQTDSPVKLKTAATSQPAPADTPRSELDFVRQQRLKRFASNTSDKSNPDQFNDSSTLSPTGLCMRSEAQHDGVATMTCNISEKPDANVVSIPNESVFEVNELIKVDRPDSAPWYGVVRWIGTLSGTRAQSALCEMEHEVEGGGSGSFQDVSYFSCHQGHGLFLPVSHLKRDDRFSDTISDEAPSIDSGITSGSPPKSKLTITPDPLLDDLLSKFLMDSSKGAEPSAPSSSEESESKGYVLYIPADRAGLVIGTGGKNIREVERLTNTSIKVVGDSGLYGGENRKVFVQGSEENCKQALLMIMKHVKRRVDEHTAGAKTISVPESCVGRIIGKGGATISAIKSISGVQDIKIEDRKTGLQAMLQIDRQCHIHGSREAIEKAEKLIHLAKTGEDIVAGATIAAIFMELLKMGVQCQEENS